MLLHDWPSVWRYYLLLLMQYRRVKKTNFGSRFTASGTHLIYGRSAPGVNCHIDFSGRVLLRLHEQSVYTLQTRPVCIVGYCQESYSTKMTPASLTSCWGWKLQVSHLKRSKNFWRRKHPWANLSAAPNKSSSRSNEEREQAGVGEESDWCYLLNGWYSAV